MTKAFVEVEINTELFGLGFIIHTKDKEMVIVLPFLGIHISPKYITKKLFYFYKS